MFTLPPFVVTFVVGLKSDARHYHLSFLMFSMSSELSLLQLLLLVIALIESHRLYRTRPLPSLRTLRIGLATSSYNPLSQVKSSTTEIHLVQFLFIHLFTCRIEKMVILE